jgi:hypothetical protein
VIQDTENHYFPKGKGVAQHPAIAQIFMLFKGKQDEEEEMRSKFNDKITSEASCRRLKAFGSVEVRSEFNCMYAFAMSARRFNGVSSCRV